MQLIFMLHFSRQSQLMLPHEGHLIANYRDERPAMSRASLFFLFQFAIIHFVFILCSAAKRAGKTAVGLAGRPIIFLHQALGVRVAPENRKMPRRWGVLFVTSIKSDQLKIVFMKP